MSIENYYKKFLVENSYPRELKSFGLLPGDRSMRLLHKGKEVINFSSSDYLGLAKHPHLISRSHEFASEWGTGSAASRLVTGNLSLYDELEKKIAIGVGKPAALIFGSGYQANITVLEALFDAKVLGQKPKVFCDRYCHTSMLSGLPHLTQFYRFRHNDYSHLESLLQQKNQIKSPIFILAESVYSMDGDTADLETLSRLAKQYNAMLYVDDAHAVGVYGPSGWGYAAKEAAAVDIIMGTFSKALGSFGGYIACSNIMRDYLINKCKGFIYSTGLSPAVLGAISGAIEILPTLDDERERLKKRADEFRQFLQSQKINYGQSTTHIIPWVIGDANKTLLVSRSLEENGILATTIRPPTVPIGTSRIRFCLSALHTDAELIKLMDVIASVNKKIN